MEEEHRPVTDAKEPPLKGVKPIAAPEIGAAGLMPDVRQGQEIENQTNK
jgi:hypothetical protein